MAAPPTFEEFAIPSAAPTIKERAGEANIEQSRASAASSQASAASSEATAEEKRALLPDKTRSQRAVADLNELRAEQARIALEKTRRSVSSLPTAENVPKAREILLREIRNLAQARELSEDMFSASGIGHNLLGGWSGSPASQVKGLLAPVTANEGFMALMELKSQGGTLGQIAVAELEALKAAGGYVPPEAGDEAFQQGIDDLISKRIKVLNKLGAAPDELAQALGPRYAEQFAPMLESYRFRREDEDALNKYVATTMADGTFDPTDFAALMGQAYYNATGNMPDETYANSAFETGVNLQVNGATSLGPLRYAEADTAARQRMLMESGVLKPDELGLGETIGGATLNFVPSTFQLAGDTVKAFTVDLPDTLEGVAKIVGGAVGLADDTEYEAVKDYFAERYGSVEGFKRALRSDPASIAADVAGIATGGSLLVAKTASTTGKLANIAKLAEAAKKAEGFAAVAAKLDPLNTAASLTAQGAKIGARAAENVGVALPAKLLGVTTADVKQAADAGRRGSAEFLDQLEGRAAPTDALSKADAAITELYQNRSRDYTRRMSRLKQNPETLDFKDVLDAVDDVRNVGRHKGIDVSGAGGVWDDVDAKITEFETQGLNSIEDFDAMKQAIGNIRDKHPRGTPEYKVANDVARAINKTITAKAPIYANIMNDYRVASDTLADIKSSLSLGAKSADTTLLKLRRSAGERGPRGRTVLELLENTKAGKGLGDMLAGQNLSGTEPTGLGASVGAVGAVGMGDPSLITAASASPRGLGKAAYTFGQGLAQIDRVRNAAASLPGADRLGPLTEKYLPPSRTAMTLANPSLIQPMVDPVEIEEQTTPIDKLAQAYSALAPTAGGNAPGQLSLSDLQEKYEGPTLGGFQPEYESAEPTGEAQSTVVIDGRIADRDPATGQMIFVDTGEPVPGFKRGGEVDKADWRGRARSVGQGVAFGFGDEIEGGVRALGSVLTDGELSRLRARYLRERDMVRRQQEAYEKANPLESLAYEGGGAMLTGLIPGGQGATATRLASLAARYPVRAGLARATAEGAAYGVGSADSVRDIPRAMAEEAAFGAGMYGATDLAGRGVRRAYRRVRGRK